MEKTISLLACLHLLYFQVYATCYFPQVFQGEYAMQMTTNSQAITYSNINITPNAIPIWGNCHRRIGNNFILKISYRETSCIRCVHLKLRSKNVLQVLASKQEIFSECFTNEDTAESYCPTGNLFKPNRTEIILFKTKDIEETFSRKEYCPFDGRYKVTYKSDNYNKTPCTKIESTMDSCPSGSTLNIRFPRCHQQTVDFKFDCLGYWDGNNEQKYLILLDDRHSKDNTPKYRCGLYKHDQNTGLVKLALSKDSTCINGLNSAEDGYETFILQPKQENRWPTEVAFMDMECSFPDWLNGNWNHVRVKDNTIIFKDQTSFKTYTIKCVGVADTEDKYLIFSRTQCDEEQYNCMWIQKRSNNIIEVQMGTHFNNTYDIKLCSDDNFAEDNWITESRHNTLSNLSCPISGEYIGRIPDSVELCAKLWSDCRAPELMYYQVSDCVTSEIYEEREYRCLGHWKEGDLLYTYTQRYDAAAGTFECFVGSIISSKEIYIKEAGEHCQRRVDPFRFGMKLVKQGLYSCIDHVTKSKLTTTEPTTSHLTTIASSSTTTKEWKIANSYPPTSENNPKINTGSHHEAIVLFLPILLFLVMLA